MASKLTPDRARRLVSPRGEESFICVLIGCFAYALASMQGIHPNVSSTLPGCDPRPVVRGVVAFWRGRIIGELGCSAGSSPELGFELQSDDPLGYIFGVVTLANFGLTRLVSCCRPCLLLAPSLELCLSSLLQEEDYIIKDALSLEDQAALHIFLIICYPSILRS